MVNRAQRSSRRFVWQGLIVYGACIVLLGSCGGVVFAEGLTHASAAAAAATSMNDPVATLSILLTAKSFSLWEAEINLPSNQASRMDPDLLEGIEDKAPVRSAAENYAEARAYNYLLVQANSTPVAAFAKSARRDLTFAHLFEEPGKYRGQIVHIEGRLGRLRRFDAPRLAAKQGVPVLYEGWIFGDAYFSNPYCVIATAVPPSVPLGESLNHRVALDGYFFKRYRYKAGDGWRDAPLLIGHALVDREVASGGTADGAFADWLFPALLAVLVITALLVVGLHWWFRHADRRMQTHLDRTRNPGFVEPGSDGP
ncbi:MAG TPA: hypothetical protein VKU02_15595 [Gemmataceae bacterium]|nr:hypothetical protein [Gemmataceae bacterium]